MLQRHSKVFLPNRELFGFKNGSCGILSVVLLTVARPNGGRNILVRTETVHPSMLCRFNQTNYTYSLSLISILICVNELLEKLF